MNRSRLLIVASLLAAAWACEWVKVPITDINARFSLAEAAWFEQEQTLFFFYRVDAEQGLGLLSQVEVRYRTDDLERPWVPLGSLAAVHTHLDADCGPSSKCGSWSVHVARPPRGVQMRLRYHRDGEMTLGATLNVNTVLSGPAHSHRSAVVYGVFDEQNLRVQWRLRHQFPAVRNEEAQALGLRRYFAIYEPRYGDVPLPINGNPYAYGAAASCPGGFTALGWTAVSTLERATFAPETVPVPAYPSAVICARATVRDALGEFSTAALARKNPEVAPAFAALRSPIQQNVTVPFFLRICDRTISVEHEEMQVQRLLLDGQPVICIDDWASPGFAGRIASEFRARIDQVRAGGRDMILMFSLHHDDTSGRLGAAVEAALANVLPFENEKSSPRVSGAFVFDGRGYSVQTPELRRLVLWCPANLPGEDDLDKIPAASVRSCPLLPDQPDLKLGPFTFGQLPILPTRAQYLKFINTYSKAQAGYTKSMTFRAPVRTPVSKNLPLGEFGVATFFNNEVLTAAPTDAFSVCPPEDGSASSVVFKVTIPTDGGFADAPLPISSLPELHQLFPFTSYPLGLAWDAPYLMRLQYEVVVAGAASAYSLSVPFGIAAENQSYYGAQLWERGEFDLKELLLRCTRFCDQPTFDSAGVYNVSALFADTYRLQCYRPKYPTPDEGGFPLDP